MALSRKPHLGEILVTGNGTRYRVDRFVSEDICAISDPNGPPRVEGKESNCFIWKFSDGTLNTWFSHEVK